MKKRNAIVLIADSNYLEYTKQVFYSAHRYGNWQGDYILLVNGVDEKELKWFKERNIHIFELKLLINKRVCNWPPIIFHKFYLLHPMMKKWDKLIYLDTDIVVLKDINHLTQIKGFAACADVYFLSIREQFLNINRLSSELQPKIKYLERKYNLSKLSFNVGMMVFDTQNYSISLFNKALKMLNDYHDVIRYPEQALFNLLFYKKWKRLYSYNNYFYPEYIFKGGINKNKLVVLHFIDKSKPWHPENIMHHIWNNNYKNAQYFPEIEQIGQKTHSTANPGFYDNLKTDINVAYRVWHNKHWPDIIKKWHKISFKIELFLKKHMPSVFFLLKKNGEK